MNSKIFETIGLKNFDIGYLLAGLTVLILILFILTIVFLVKVVRLQKRYNKFLKINLDKNRKDIRNLYKKMESTFQKAGLVKYDAFSQMGGQLSFSLALLDENNNGFILNSVHSAEGCYSYTKEIKNGESKISLGDEEAQALARAMEK